MIKDFFKISKKDLDYLMTHEFTVWEKLDMCYFRVEITKIGAIPLKGSTGRVISDIDCVTNSLYKDICDFVNKNVNPIRNQIIDEYGEGYIGFFFLPVTEYHKINYTHLKPKTVILSDWSYDIKMNDDKGYFRILDLAKLLRVEQPPLVTTWNTSDEDNISYMHKDFSYVVQAYLENTDEDATHTLLNYLMGNPYGPSGNYVSSIEGLIIRTDKFQYQIKINDTEDNIDKSTKLIYRDTLLNSIAEYYSKNKSSLDDVFNKEESYIDRVSKLFLSYIENTDLFAKFSIDPEDLLPPTSAYFGDIDFDMISDSNVKLICKYNEVNKNIFRLFLHTFAQKISEDKFSSLTDSTKAALNDLIIHLKYKNYKEILLTAYKAKN